MDLRPSVADPSFLGSGCLSLRGEHLLELHGHALLHIARRGDVSRRRYLDSYVSWMKIIDAISTALSLFSC